MRRSKIRRRPWTAVELSWVAGLLEGEGCFRALKSVRNISVACQMTDLDVLRRLQYVVGGLINGPYQTPGRRPRSTWQVRGAQARVLMAQLLPQMGLRRSKRIKQLMRAYDATERTRSHGNIVVRLQHVNTGRVEETSHLPGWLRRHKMSASGLYRTLTGARKQCKGWRRLS